MCFDLKISIITVRNWIDHDTLLTFDNYLTKWLCHMVEAEAHVHGKLIDCLPCRNSWSRIYSDSKIGLKRFWSIEFFVDPRIRSDLRKLIQIRCKHFNVKYIFPESQVRRCIHSLTDFQGMYTFPRESIDSLKISQGMYTFPNQVRECIHSLGKVRIPWSTRESIHSLGSIHSFPRECIHSLKVRIPGNMYKLLFLVFF